MSIKIVRLNSGEEILCDHSFSDDVHTLKKPLIIIPSGGGGIGFMSWMPYADTKDGVNIPNNFVAFFVDPDDQLKGEYASYTSDIVVPQSNVDKKIVTAQNTILPKNTNSGTESFGPVGSIIPPS